MVNQKAPTLNGRVTRHIQRSHCFFVTIPLRWAELLHLEKGQPIDLFLTISGGQITIKLGETVETGKDVNDANDWRKMETKNRKSERYEDKK